MSSKVPPETENGTITIGTHTRRTETHKLEDNTNIHNVVKALAAAAATAAVITCVAYFLHTRDLIRSKCTLGFRFSRSVGRVQCVHWPRADYDTNTREAIVRRTAVPVCVCVPVRVCVCVCAM